MAISFQGVRNVGGLSIKKPNEITGKQENIYAEFNIQLTNDCDGKDLDNFEAILKRFPHPLNKNALTIEYDKGDDEHEESFYLNLKPLTMETKDLAVFDKLVPLLDKIATKDNSSFVVNKDYLTGEDCDALYKGLTKHYKPE